MKRFLRTTVTVLLAVVLLLPTWAFAQPAPSTLPKIAFTGNYEFLTAAEDRLLELINDMRQNPGNYKLSNGTRVSQLYSGTRKPLAKSTTMQSISRYKSLYMMAYSDFSHNYTRGPLAGVGSGGVGELVFYDSGNWSENIAARYGYGTDTARKIGEGLFDQWLNSTGHRDSMMSASYTHIGIGVVGSKQSPQYTVYGTKQFNSMDPASLNKALPNPLTTGGTESAPTPTPTKTPVPTPTPTKTPTPTPTTTPTASPSTTPSASPSATPSTTPSASPSASPSATPSTKPTTTPTQRPSTTATPRPITTPRPTQSPTVTIRPTQAPASTPTPKPTASATPKPSANQSGWVKVGTSWMYRDSNGRNITGWVRVGGTWYYMHPSGFMATGWVKVGNTWYFMKPSGAMATGWQYTGGKWYYMKSSGAMATGWVKLGNTWYYLHGSGAMATGWVKLGNTWYYLYPSGAMATGTIRVGNTTYRLDSSGAWIR